MKDMKDKLNLRSITRIKKPFGVSYLEWANMWMKGYHGQYPWQVYNVESPREFRQETCFNLFFIYWILNVNQRK